jgi:hypothetical protein
MTRALFFLLMLAGCALPEATPRIFRISATSNEPGSIFNAPVALGTFSTRAACEGYAPFIMDEAVYTGACGLDEFEIRQRLQSRFPNAEWTIETISTRDYRDARERADQLIIRNGTALLEERGFRTLTSESGDRFSIDERVLAAAFTAGCRDRQPPRPACDVLSAYEWSIALEPNGWLTINFSHRDILNTDSFGAFGCAYEQDRWLCTREHE